MSEKETVINIENLGKMYKLYKNPKDKILDAFGFNKFKKNYYKEFWALRGINLIIKKGERIGFIGHNGAGKSTLLKIITGNILPTEGTVTVKGKIQALLEMGTGFHPEFTGRQNIRASLVYQGLSSEKIAKYESEIIEFTELEDFIDQPVKTYSAGMYSRLAFATASAVVPELMIIDEILGAGDAYFNGKCVEKMQKLTRDEGATVLFVSHDLQSVQNLCTRVIWINKGKIVYDGDVLTGIKLYLQSVRQNEEQRLKLRDIKALKKQGFFADKESELYDSRLFRLISKPGQEAEICKVYKISVHSEGREIDNIDIGASMDNDLNSNCHIIEEVGLTSWGKASKDGEEYYREYRRDLGKEAQAPFIIKVSKLYADNIELQIDALTEGAGEVFLEEYSEEDGVYHKCNKLLPGRNITFAGLKHDIDKNQLTAEQPIDVINTDKAKIEDVVIISKSGLEGNVFSYDDNIGGIRFRLRLADDFSLSQLFISIALYNIKGDLVHSTLQKIELFDKTHYLDIDYPITGIKFGPGEYTISIGIYDYLDVSDNTKEQKFLVLFDRAVSFCIEKPMDFALNIGLVNTASKITINNSEKVYKCNFLI